MREKGDDDDDCECYEVVFVLVTLRPLFHLHHSI